MFRICSILAVLVIAPLIEALGLCVDGVGCLHSPGQSPKGDRLVDISFNPVQPVGMVTVGTKFNQSFGAIFDTGKHSAVLPSRPKVIAADKSRLLPKLVHDDRYRWLRRNGEASPLQRIYLIRWQLFGRGTGVHG